MDYEDFDGLDFDPQMVAIRRYLKFFSILLLATFILPIDRINLSPVNVWDRFGVDDALTMIRWVLPAVVGLTFLYLGWLSSASLKVTAGLITACLLLVVLVGVNPLEIMRVVVPPLSGGWTDTYFGTVEGAYFPREDALHQFFLGAGLVGLGVGGRYSGLLNSSRFSRWISLAAIVMLLAYYLFPYGSRVPAERNIELYKSYYVFADQTPQFADTLKEKLGKEGRSDEFRQMRRIAERRIANMKGLGQLRLTAAYYAVVYFIPVLLLLFMLPALKKARYRGHNIIFAGAVGWGASVYLLAFLFPLLVKETMRVTGPGFLGNLRSYIIFAAVFVGLTVGASTFLKEWLEGGATDDHLPKDPLQWTEDQTD